MVVISGEGIETEDEDSWLFCDEELIISDVRVQKSLMCQCILRNGCIYNETYRVRWCDEQ